MNSFTFSMINTTLGLLIGFGLLCFFVGIVRVLWPFLFIAAIIAGVTSCGDTVKEYREHSRVMAERAKWDEAEKEEKERNEKKTIAKDCKTIKEGLVQMYNQDAAKAAIYEADLKKAVKKEIGKEFEDLCK